MSSTDKPAVVCLTPVKNEAWILDRFLRAASLWADVIIIADQQSDDDSRAIARRYPKVRLFENTLAEYNEVARQRVLIEHGRSIPGPRLFIALDADEFLAPGSWTGQEWQDVLGAAPGTVIRFPWLNIRPGFRQYWSSAAPMPFGFVDDGSEHSGAEIHSPRIPVRPDSPTLQLERTSVLHLQYTDWRRMESKHRWYQCLERIRTPRRSAIGIYRQYHHMDAVPERALRCVPVEWVANYAYMGIDISTLGEVEFYRWDREVLGYFEQHGTAVFNRESIWDVDWTRLAARLGMDDPERFRDPRSGFTRGMHRWLKSTQPVSHRGYVRLQEWVARRLLGW